MADAGGRSGGKRYSSSGARGPKKGRGDKGKDENKTRAEGKQDKGSEGQPGRGKLDSSKGVSAKR